LDKPLIGTANRCRAGAAITGRFPMFAYILRADSPPDEKTDEFFKRFVETPGLLHAFDLRGVNDPDDTLVVTIWQDRKAAEDYLNKSPLRKEVDQTISGITRTMYEVLNSK
jgi:heme-degrading monooxygenase HmoA